MKCFGFIRGRSLVSGLPPSFISEHRGIFIYFFSHLTQVSIILCNTLIGRYLLVGYISLQPGDLPVRGAFAKWEDLYILNVKFSLYLKKCFHHNLLLCVLVHRNIFAMATSLFSVMATMT